MKAIATIAAVLLLAPALVLAGRLRPQVNVTLPDACAEGSTYELALVDEEGALMTPLEHDGRCAKVDARLADRVAYRCVSASGKSVWSRARWATAADIDLCGD